jgi:uncharacterized membrane protein YfcA
MLREWVLAGLGVRSWGFDVEFLFGFFGCFLLFFVSFLYTPCMLRGAFYAFLIYYVYYLSKKKKKEKNKLRPCYFIVCQTAHLLFIF